MKLRKNGGKHRKSIRESIELRKYNVNVKYQIVLSF
jgi:hypothetical protein